MSGRDAIWTSVNVYETWTLSEDPLRPQYRAGDSVKKEFVEFDFQTSFLEFHFLNVRYIHMTQKSENTTSYTVKFFSGISPYKKGK